MSSTGAGRPKDSAEEPKIIPNPALDIVEQWTKGCRMWNDCNDCPVSHACEKVGDMVIGFLSEPRLTVKIRLICSSSIA